MNSWRKQITAAVQATRLHSPTRYSWFGKLSPPLPRTFRKNLSPESARNYLRYALQTQLYQDFYSRGFAAFPDEIQTIPFQSTGRAALLDRLSAANSGRGPLEKDFEVLSTENDMLLVQWNGLKLRVHQLALKSPANSSTSASPFSGLPLPKEFLSLTPGFYMALGNESFVWNSPQTVVRLYWHLSPDGAVRFMHAVIEMLNQASIPFKLKALDNPSHYTRCDAVVLYVLRHNFQEVSGILEKLYPQMRPDLAPGIPVFTKYLAPGLSLAEDPNNGESFGMNRCQLLAEGLIRSYEQKKRSVTTRLEMVEQVFYEAGISFDRPYLNPDASGDYDFHLKLPHRARSDVSQEISLGADQNAYLRVAEEIGRRLDGAAIWHGDRCTWLGPDLSFHNGRELGRSLAKTYGTLDASLYSGTSGIGLFLAELSAITRDEDARRTALGAIRQAFSKAETIAPENRFGLYTGWTGIAYAAARIGNLLEETSLLEKARMFLLAWLRESPETDEFDLISGKAGAAVALVRLADLLQEAAFLEFAVHFGNDLLQSAGLSEGGISWSMPDLPKKPGMTGFSHGSAGVGYALLELFRATGEVHFRHAAEQAFDYERYWFDASVGNWPDFRQTMKRGLHKKTPKTFAAAWCHGAPGIALTRLRAWEICGDEASRVEAAIALKTTRAAIEQTLASETGNYSLCHGLAGNASVLQHGVEVLGKPASLHASVAHRVAAAGIHQYHSPGRGWPCGLDGRETPGLMLGLAGIGHFYLRMSVNSVRSILIL